MNLSHSGNLGDIVYSLPTVIALQRQSNSEVNLYLKTFAQAAYYIGAFHPYGNYKMTDDAAEYMIPLLQEQSYIKKIDIWTNQKIDYALDSFRTINGLDLSRGYLARWYFYTFSVTFDLSRPWLFVEKSNKDLGIVVNRSFRYRNLGIDYKFLSDYSSVHFVGLEEEYVVCRKEIPKLEWIQTKNALELAEVIASAKLFIGNQSFPFAIAEGLKAPRVLEVCPWSPNIIPHGDNAWDAYFQALFEVNVENFMSAV